MGGQVRSGVVDGDGRSHAVERRRLSHRALCGAGRIMLVLPARFDPADRLACGACVALVREQAGESG